MTLTSDSATTEWIDDVLAFWFGELGPEQWFTGGAELDQAIRDRFSKLHADLALSLPPDCHSEPRAALAAIVVFDQFPRNIHRGKAQAFATDAIAIALARNAVDRELDAAMGADERKFLYMPFMHSEVLADQERGVDLFRALGDQEALDYAVEHRDIIAEFGRFPHRNRALSREATEAERKFLESHQGFGQ